MILYFCIGLVIGYFIRSVRAWYFNQWICKTLNEMMGRHNG